MLYSVCMSATWFDKFKKIERKKRNGEQGRVFSNLALDQRFDIPSFDVAILTSEQRERPCSLDNNESSLRCTVKEGYELFTYLNHYSINNSYISSGKCYT